MLKKILLSLFVVGSFIIYSFQQRHENSAPVVAPVPKSSSSPSSPSASNTSSNSSTPSSSSSSSSGQGATYKDGTYTGSAADALYGYIQVKATVQGGKLTDVQFLQYPNDRENSIRINSQAMPWLKQEAISAQSAHVDIISGATDTSQAFIESLSSALSQAQA